MTESFEFSQIGSYDEALYYQHAQYPTNTYPIPNQPKIEQLESLPPINEAFNETSLAPPLVFDPLWSGYSYKESSPYPFDNTYAACQLESSTMERAFESNGFAAWSPLDSMSLAQPTELMSNHLQPGRPFWMYDQGSISSTGLRLQSPGGTLICHVPRIQESTTTLDYQPIYTHSPTSIGTQPIGFHPNDIGEFGEHFIDVKTFGSTPESSSTGTPQTSGSPVTHHPSMTTKKSAYRVNRNGKIVKKVSQNCHANSQCSNCKTLNTTLWRRNAGGEVECNACNLYFRKNGTRRPVKLQKRGIMRRTRNPRQPYSSNVDDPNYLRISISP